MEHKSQKHLERRRGDAAFKTEEGCWRVTAPLTRDAAAPRGGVGGSGGTDEQLVPVSSSICHFLRLYRSGRVVAVSHFLFSYDPPRPFIPLISRLNSVPAARVRCGLIG